MSNVILGGALFYILLQFFKEEPIAAVIRRDLLTLPGRLVMTYAFFVIGYFLYVLKKGQQYWYGVFETLFAACTCFYSASNIVPELYSDKFNPFFTLTILSSIYLLVRGFSNIDEGRLKPYFLKHKLGWHVVDIDPETGERKPSHWD